MSTYGDILSMAKGGLAFTIIFMLITIGCLTFVLVYQSLLNNKIKLMMRCLEMANAAILQREIPESLLIELMGPGGTNKTDTTNDLNDRGDRSEREPPRQREPPKPAEPQKDQKEGKRAFKDTNDPRYQTLFEVGNVIFDKGTQVKGGKFKKTDNPEYQTLHGLENEKVFGSQQAAATVATKGFRPVNDPNYQTLVNLDNKMFEKGQDKKPATPPAPGPGILKKTEEEKKK